jgi:hypothetical protein
MARESVTAADSSSSPFHSVSNNRTGIHARLCSAMDAVGKASVAC